MPPTPDDLTNVTWRTLHRVLIPWQDSQQAEKTLIELADSLPAAIERYGRIAAALIVPPTSQNQAAIEADLTRVVVDGADLDDAALTTLCERAIRNYDPCISCATHFLTLTVMRR